MPLPEQIPVRYTEEDAGYVSMRPVVKQTFHLNELADMVVSVTGKDAARVQQIFRSGTVVYNGYRYSWEGIPAELAEIASLLRPFPDDDPARPFHPEEAKSVLFEMGGGTQRNVVEIPRADGSEKKLFGKTRPGTFSFNVRASTPHATRSIRTPARPTSTASRCLLRKARAFWPPCSKRLLADCAIVGPRCARPR